MNMPDSSLEVEVVSRGWRFNPWGARIVLGIGTAVALYVIYSIGGAPLFSSSNAIPLAVVLAVAALSELGNEITTVRSVHLNPESVRFEFPLTQKSVVWRDLTLAEIQPSSVEKMMMFAQKMEDGRVKRYFRVTIEQGSAIVSRLEKGANVSNAIHAKSGT
jgi:hypothetical protein